jgi:hypothetical protein
VKAREEAKDLRSQLAATRADLANARQYLARALPPRLRKKKPKQGTKIQPGPLVMPQKDLALESGENLVRSGECAQCPEQDTRFDTHVYLEDKSLVDSTKGNPRFHSSPVLR